MAGKPNSKSRRTVLKTTGMAFTGLAGLSGQTMGKSKSKVSAEEAGIRSAVTQLTKEGKTLEALSLLKKHNVEYTASITFQSGHSSDDVINTLSQESAENEVSTQDFFTRSDSNIVTYGWNLSGNLYRLQTDFTLKAFDDVDPDLTAPYDELVLAYKDSPFRFEPDSITYDGPKGGDQMEVREYPVTDGSGLVIDVKDDYFIETNQDTYQGYASLDVNKEESGKGNFAGQYHHTWSVANASKITGAVEFAWKGLGISLDLNELVADSWDIYDSEDI